MIRVLIAVGDAGGREQVRAVLAAEPDVAVVGLARDGQEAVQMAHALRPDAALLAPDLAVCDGWQAAEFLASSGLPTDSLLLLPEVGPDDLRRAMRAGARECLAWPLEVARLAPALRRMHGERQRRGSPAFAAAGDPAQMTRLFAVSGAKGGVGKTTLAVNLALALWRETGEPTVLVDLYTQFGDVATLLNLVPRRSLAELAARPGGELDAALLGDHTERHESGLLVLTGAAAPVALDALSAPFLDRVFGLLKQTARFVVLDVPPVLHPATLHALSHASQALLVANLYDMTTIRDTRLLLDALEGKYVPAENIAVVLNRASRRNALAVADIERALGRPVAAQVPNDGRLVPHSINQGVPFVLSHPDSAVARSVRDLACQLVGGPAPNAADRPPTPNPGGVRKGWWAK